MSLNRVQQILQVDTSKTCTILSIRHFPGLARPEKQPLRRRPGTNITFPKVKKYDSVSKTIYGTETKVGMRSSLSFFPSKYPSTPELVMATTAAKTRMKKLTWMLNRYIEYRKRYDTLITKRTEEFEMGKSLLSQMMGWEKGQVSQRDVDKAIEYLFPSGLFEKKARPTMKPPEEYTPKIPMFDFDQLGRPDNGLFYTHLPNFYAIMSEVGQKSLDLIRHHDEQIRVTGKTPEELFPKHLAINLYGSKWISKEVLVKRIGEKLTETQYASLIQALEHLASLPNSYMELTLINKFRKGISETTKPASLWDVRKLPIVHEKFNEKQEKIRHVLAKTYVKRTDVEVTVTEPGTGQYTVDGHGLDSYRSLMARYYRPVDYDYAEIFLSPLVMTNLLGKVDVKAKIVFGPGGLSVVPRAVRHGVSLALLQLFPETFNVLNYSGLLTRDPRVRERDKINHKGPRAKWPFKKR